MFTRMMGALTGGSPDAGGGPPPDEDPAAAASGVGAPPATPPVTRGGVRVDTVAAVRGALYHTPAAHAAAQDVVYLSAVASVERRSPGGWHLTVADGDAIGGEAPSSPSSFANSDSDDGGGGGGTQPALATRATWPLDAASLQLTASRDGSQLAWSDAAAAPAAAAPPSTSGRWAFDVDPADAAAAPTFVTLLARGLALHGDADVTITAEALLAEVSSARAPSGAPVAAAAASVEEMVRVEPAPSPSADGVAGGGVRRPPRPHSTRRWLHMFRRRATVATLVSRRRPCRRVPSLRHWWTATTTDSPGTKRPATGARGQGRRRRRLRGLCRRCCHQRLANAHARAATCSSMTYQTKHLPGSLSGCSRRWH